MRFIPAANFGKSAGFGADLLVEVTGRVVQVNEEHRWYRTAYELPGGTGHECFKF